MTPAEAREVDNILAGFCRRGARLIREAAYIEAVTDAVAGDRARGGELYLARQRFTPGWSGRRQGRWTLGGTLALPLAAQEPRQRRRPYLMAHPAARLGGDR